MNQKTETTLPPNRIIGILLLSGFLTSICGILYELLISTVSSYFQGSSVLHFSLVIGFFLSFMGVGSFFSRYTNGDLIRWFIRFEVILSLLGGFSTFILYFAFSLTPYFYFITFSLIGILGIFIGIEIPVLTRIVRKYDSLTNALANVLSFDYLGALVASLLFPLLLLPYAGTMRTAFIVGFMNLLVAIGNTWVFRKTLKDVWKLYLLELVVGVLLLGGIIFSFELVGFYDKFLYRDNIMLSKQSTYQQIVVTKWNKDVRLYLNGNLQFSSRDEYRYHESLVHVPVSFATAKEKILILGGGDGLAARELLKYDDIGSIEVVDLDPAITDIAQQNEYFKTLNADAMNHPKVTIHNMDAYKFIEASSDYYNVILIDLPDPSNTDLGKLYSLGFYNMIQGRLAAGGVLVTQSTSPFFAPEAFWCIHNTMKETFPNTVPYQVYIPTFGQWGFNMGIKEPTLAYDNDSIITNQLAKHITDTDEKIKYRFLAPEMVQGLFQFGKDESPMDTKTNRVDNHILLQYYSKGWNRSR